MDGVATTIVGTSNQASAAESVRVFSPATRKAHAVPSNDDSSAMRGTTPFLPDAHGHAALLLVESLIHGLCENGTIDADEAVAITERAADVQFEQAEAADGAGAGLWRSHALLSAIATSLRIDGSHDPRSPHLVP